MAKVKTLLLISRPLFWPTQIFVYLAGIITASLSWIHILGLIFVTFPLGLIISGLNDIADRESDQLNKRKGDFEGYLLKPSEVRTVYIGVAGVSLLFMVWFLAIGLTYSALLIFLIIIATYLYSFKPIRLKGRPIFDSLTLGVGLLLVYLFGKSLNLNSFTAGPKIPLAVFLIIIGSVGLHALTTLWDKEIDQKMGDKTTGVFLGARGTAIFALLIFSLVLFMAKNYPPIILTYLILSIFVILVIFLKPASKLIHLGVWLIIGGFVVMSILLLLFDLNFVFQSLRY